MRKDLLKGKMAEKGVSGVELASELSMNAKTFYNRFNGKGFFLEEAKIIAERLGITEPAEIISIFFN